MELQDIKSMTLAEIQESFTNDKLPKFRALQVYQWLHRGAESFDEMSNLSKELREQLKGKYYISVATVEKKLVSNYDNTVKYLFSFADNCCVESVVMQYKHGYSICISTQVGCRMCTVWSNPAGCCGSDAHGCRNSELLPRYGVLLQ